MTTIETLAALDGAARAVLSFLLTYGLHSTLLLGTAALAAARAREHHALRELLWKTALVGSVATAALQLAAGYTPLGGRWSVASEPASWRAADATAAAAATSDPVVNRQAVKPVGDDESTAARRVASAAPDAAAGSAQRDGQSGRAAAPRSAAGADDPGGNGAAAEVPEPLSPTRSIAANAAPSTAAAATQTRAADVLLAASLRSWPLLAVAAWLAIALVGLARVAAADLRLRRLLRDRWPVLDPALLRTLDALREAAGERRPVRLGTSLACTVPVAIRGGEIVVPPRFLAELDDELRRAGLAHELAHLRRRDPQWQLLALLLERVFPFQPLHRLARRALRESAEYLCDKWSARQVGSPLLLARCIETVAAWVPATGAPLPETATAMARRSSPVVQRIERLLAGDGRPARRRPSPALAALPLLAVVIAAPVVSATSIRLDSADDSAERNTVITTGLWKQGDEHREIRTVPDWTPAEFERARAALQVSRPPSPAAPLAERWRWALDDAAERGRRDFWIVYAFTTPTHQRDLMISDSAGTWLVDFKAAANWRGQTMLDLIDAQPRIGGDGSVFVLVHYRAARADALDRGVYRSARLPFDFGRQPVYWLGHAGETESLAMMDRLQARSTRDEDLRTLFIEAASLHPTSDLVIPFLQRLLDLREPDGIRKEAAEGFDHHHDPRSVRILLGVAMNDPALDVRAEAAETIGEVQVPESVPALLDLARHGEHEQIRGEAAEGLGEQPAARALPAIAELLADDSVDDQALGEAVEAVGNFHGEPRATKLLLDTAWHHPSQHVRQEAVETLGELPDPGIVKALVDLAWRADDSQVQLEAIETLGEVHAEGDVNPEQAAGEDVVSALRRIVWEHPDPEAQSEAVETLADRLGDAAIPELRRVARQHPDENVRDEARDALGQGKEHDDKVDQDDDSRDMSEDHGDTANDG